MNITTNFIITCDRAFLTVGSNNLNLIEVFNQIHATQFPFTYPHFALVTNFDIDNIGQHTLMTEIISHDNLVLAEAQLPINITSPNFQVITNFESLTFPTPGKYEIKVSIDNTYIGSRFLTVTGILKQKPHIA